MGIDLGEKVKALEKRLQALEDERSIRSTLYAYGHAIDYGLKEKWLDLFTEDAIYRVEHFGTTIPELPGGSQPAGGLQGRNALGQYINNHTSAPSMWHKHMLAEPVISLHSDREASVESYFARLDEDENGAFITAFGRYRDRMVKGQDGKWRFAERICEMESRFPKR
jgi:3-phenylpropionate/cinnamic acid dioxygenase small subunit